MEELKVAVESMVAAALRLASEKHAEADDAEPMLTPSQAAKRLNISPHTVHEEIKAGRLHAYRFGTRCIRIKAADLAAYVHAQKTKPAAWQFRADLGLPQPGAVAVGGGLAVRRG